MNIALESYIRLSEILLKLCQSTGKDDFLSGIKDLGLEINYVNEHKLFPFCMEYSSVNTIRPTTRGWKKDRNEVCRQLYVELATLMYRFEASNIYNRAYFDYIIEYARTSLPYNVVNEWGKEYVLDKQFSQEGFFFAINRDKRFLQKSKSEYENYCRIIREKDMPEKPIEKAIPSYLQKEIHLCYNNYYNEYCDCIEKFYPEIKELFINYNIQVRIYLCSYGVHKENPKIDFVLANYYRSAKREVYVYPYYVDLAYRFCNVEEVDNELVGGCLSAFNSSENIYNFFNVLSIHHDANSQFVKHASIEKIREYVCYFLRGCQKTVNIQTDGTLKINDETLIFSSEDISMSQLDTLSQSTQHPHFLFRFYPQKSLIEHLKKNDIPWSCVFHYGQGMINNDNEQMVRWFINNNIEELRNIQIDNKAELIKQKLDNCKPGKLYWHDYELIGEDVFEYLFKDDFQDYQFKIQSITDDGIQRRDLVVYNNYKDVSSFWGRIHSQFGCNTIIVDFKNYEAAIDSNCLYNATKYISSSLGCFVLIITRIGISESGKIEQARLLRDNKLVLCISDNELKEMIRYKQIGKNPCYMLDRLYFSLMQFV